jgi:Flp pilus assembly protein TadG
LRLSPRTEGPRMFSTHALSNSGTPRARIQTRRKQRGQSMVEFALVLPILLLLTLIALDFGRVYLGWINLQNMTRIAANFAANNPTAWTGTGDATIQLQYKNQVLADASASNCVLPTDDVSGVTKVPPPTFTYANGHGTPGLGDTAQVGISCRFGVITPVISNILGGQVNVSSSSVFPVKSGMTGTGGAGGGGSKPNAAFTGNGMTNTTTVNGTTTLRPPSAGPRRSSSSSATRRAVARRSGLGTSAAASWRRTGRASRPPRKTRSM